MGSITPVPKDEGKFGAIGPRQRKGSRPGRPAAYRLWEIDQWIASGRYPNVPWMAQQLEVSKRTVERDIAYLRDVCRAPLDFDFNRRGYYYREHGYRLPPLNLTQGELSAILISAPILSQYMETPFAPVARDVLQKLALLFPGEVSVDLDSIQGAVSTTARQTPSGTASSLKHFETLTKAILQRQTVRLVYYSMSRDTVTERDVDPYHVFLARDVWYVIAYCHLRHAVRLFAVHRIREIEGTGRTFRKPTDFSPQRYMGLAWQVFRGEPETVVLEFHGQAARLARERTWHPTQQLEDAAGQMILRLQVPVTPDLVSWILSWGASCRVVRPQSLQKKILSEFQYALDAYEAT